MSVRAKAIVEWDKTNYLMMVSDMEQALREAAEKYRLFMSTQPPHREKHLSGPLPGGFYSQKQQRYVMAALREGKITVPYDRTADLERSWTVGPVEKAGDDLQVEVSQDSSLAPYGRHVQDPKVRPPMHGDWPSPDSALEVLGPGIQATLEDVARRYGFL